MSQPVTQPNQLLEELLPEVKASRQSKYAVSPLFLNRWSSRSYADRSVPDEVLNAVLEAASWAPSASNNQPWRFLVAKTAEQRQAFESFINPSNRLWTDRAPVLIVLLSKTVNDKGEPNRTHAFDTGAAWGHLAIQAELLGLSTRTIGGFNRDLARSELNVPDEYEIIAITTLGYRGAKELLPEALQEREVPNGRRPLADSVIEGKFPNKA